MLRFSKKAVGWLAVYAIVLQTLLAGYQPAVAKAAFDPLAVTCLNASPDAGSSDAGHARLPPRCGECVLCAAIPVPPAPDAGMAVVFHTRPAGLPALDDASAPKPDAFPTPSLPRGPPSAA